MSYRIEYGVSKIEQSLQRRNNRIGWFFSTVVLLLVILSTFIWPEWAKTFHKELFPLFTGKGIQIVRNFSNNLEMGSSLSDAIEVFCWEIMNGSIS